MRPGQSCSQEDRASTVFYIHVKGMANEKVSSAFQLFLFIKMNLNHPIWPHSRIWSSIMLCVPNLVSVLYLLICL